MRAAPGWRTRALAVALVLVAGLAQGCAPSTGGNQPTDPPSSPGRGASSATPAPRLEQKVTLRVLGSTDLKDMKEVVGAAAEATNVALDIAYVGSPVGAQTVASGKADGKYDVLWFDSNAYLSLQPKAAGRVATSTKTMTSPVAFGLDSQIARRLGWDRKPPTWAAIARAASAGKFSYGMSNPATSNAAFTALASVATALAGSGGVLEADQVDEVAPDLRRFFSAQNMTSESASELADRFAAKFGKRGGSDGLLNYESELVGLNASGKLKRPLTVVIPSDGVTSADFPIALLSGASPATQSAYEVLTDWLRSPAAQQLIMDKTSRRPVSPGVKPDSGKFGKRMLIELPFPARRAVLDRLLTSYLNSIRRSTQSIYVLDLSGSMQGERITALRNALISLAGGSGKVSSSGYAVFRRRETVTLIGYSDSVQSPKAFSIPAEKPGAALARIRRAAAGLKAEPNNTATYSALRAAYRLADREVRAHPGALTSIVLMTDGETNRGINGAEFRSFYRKLPHQTRSVPTFTVKFGTADAGALGGIARLTGGKLFSVKGTRLVTAFRQIRAYQ
jgi:Ca-activated chloride channel family protein